MSTADPPDPPAMNIEAQRQAACCELLHEVALREGSVRLRACGASMIPAVWPGDVLLIEACQPSDLERGAIALIHRDGRLFAHRVLGVGSDGIKTRGDAVSAVDPAARADQLVGRVVSVTRGGSARGSRMRSPRFTFPQRIASLLLRRSALLLGVTLFLARRLRPVWDVQPSFSESRSAAAE